MVLNNWDLKTTNNRIYEATDPAATPRRQFMVRDVGSSLGHSKQFRLFAMLGTRGSAGQQERRRRLRAAGLHREGRRQQGRASTIAA